MLDSVGEDTTVLDIGAGVGRWTLRLSEKVAHVTAVEPLAGMCELLEERVRTRGIDNVALVSADWMQAQVEPHDVVVSVHSTYASSDLMGFVRKMEEKALGTCFLVLRVPAADGAMGELSERIRGCWHDSPNFVVGINALMEAGVYPNVHVEEVTSRAWVDVSMAQAIGRARRHLRLDSDSEDGTIREVLERRLVSQSDGLHWPDGMRSALCWWKPRPDS